jgi:hypothetical protein
LLLTNAASGDLMPPVATPSLNNPRLVSTLLGTVTTYSFRGN